jgi:hypothetical protein
MSQVVSGVATAAGPASIPSLIGSGADLVQASGRQLGSDTTPQERVAETTSPEAQTPAAPTVVEKPKFSDEVAKTAETFGVDISGFTDEANAQFAIQQAINHAARIGSRPFETQQQPEVVPTEDEDDDDIDFASLDPKVAARVRKVQEQAASAVQFVQQLKQQQAAEQQAQAKRLYDGLVSRATKAIDDFKSPDFGVGQQVTVAQQLQRRNLMDVTASVIQGQRINGRDIEIEDAIKAALVILGKTPAQQQIGPAGKALPPGSGVAGGAPAPVRPYFSKNRPGWDLTGVATDPNMQRGLAEIFAK